MRFLGFVFLFFTTNYRLGQSCSFYSTPRHAMQHRMHRKTSLANERAQLTTTLSRMTCSRTGSPSSCE
uniref:Putative secreted protein n=1 Tax=Anopheles marajoara TaxID=58244 RepID=A0A2M4CFA6_9DIPT